MNKSKILLVLGSFSKQIDFFFPVLNLFLAGCGYSIMGGNPPLPMEAKSIGIQPVENHTFVAGLDTKTNAAIKNLLETNASVEIVPATKADLQLSISLNEIRSKTRGLDSIQSAGGVVFYLSGSVELNQRVDEEMIWREKNLSVEVAEGNSNGLAANSIALSQDHLDALSQLFAEKIYHRLFLEF